MINIQASDDVTDYRGYLITDFGDYVEVVDASDESMFGIYDSVLEAEREIDEIFYPGEDAEVLAIEHKLRRNEISRNQFARQRGIDIDQYGNVLSDVMQHPRYDDVWIAITYDSLSSMVKSFNRYTGASLKVKYTADGLKVVCY